MAGSAGVAGVADAAGAAGGLGAAGVWCAAGAACVSDAAGVGTVPGAAGVGARAEVEAGIGLVVGPVVAAVDVLGSLDVGSVGAGELVAVLGVVARAEACLVAARAVLVDRLAGVSSTVEFEVAAAAGVEVAGGVRAMAHAEVLRRLPAVSAALASGRVLGWVPEVIAGVRAALPAKLRSVFDGFDAAFVEAASAVGCTRRGFADVVRGWADGVLRDHGLTRRQRQRGGVRCRTWTSSDTGMFGIHAVLDPDRGVAMSRVLEQVTSELLADRERLAEVAGDGVVVPDDPGERTQFARALALHVLMTGGGPGVGRPEVIVVVDKRAESCDAQGRPAIDTGTGLELFQESVDELIKRAVIHVVEVDDNQPVAPDDVANKGRGARHATGVQRRLLRAVHPGCVVPGCRATFERTHIHHAREWEHGGLTDLGNLLPLCPHHHAWLHGLGAWIELGPRRCCIVHLPDGAQLHWPAPNRTQPGRAQPARPSQSRAGPGGAAQPSPTGPSPTGPSPTEPNPTERNPTEPALAELGPAAQPDHERPNDGGLSAGSSRR